MSLTDHKTLSEIRSLNERFHSESLEPKGLFCALRQLGIEPMHSVLIELYPDSGDTWSGELVNESMGPLKFDLDLANHTNSNVEKLGDDRFANRRGQILWSAVLVIRDELAKTQRPI